MNKMEYLDLNCKTGEFDLENKKRKAKNKRDLLKKVRK